LLGEGDEFLVGGQLLLDFGNKLGTNELGCALASMLITELVEGAMFLRLDGIDALATRFLTSAVLLG